MEERENSERGSRVAIALAIPAFVPTDFGAKERLLAVYEALGKAFRRSYNSMLQRNAQNKIQSNLH